MAAPDTRSTPWPRLELALIASVCVIAVGAALMAQHRLGMQPCPWCILQRVQFLLIAIVAALGALLSPPMVPRIVPRLASWLVTFKNTSVNTPKPIKKK